MGLDPNDDHYESGTDCPSCHNTLFAGVTPRFVLANIDLIVKCRPLPSEPPNGSHILEQSPINPCVWVKPIPGGDIRWTVGPADSRFMVVEGIGWWFFCIYPELCHDVFVCQNDCSNPAQFGSGGKAAVFWGPQIGKDPIS